MSRLLFGKTSVIEPTVSVGLNGPPARKEPHSLSQQVVLNSRRFVSSLLNQQSDFDALDLPLPVFGLVWVVVVGAHVLCAVFLACLAVTYSYLTNPVMAYYVQLWAPTTGNQYYGFYSVMFALVGVIHALRALQLVYRSTRERQLVFQRGKLRQLNGSFNAAHTRPNNSTSMKQLFKANIVARLTESRQPRYNMFLSSAKLGWQALFSRQGLLGVEGQYFLTIFLIREVVELSTQTYQAYRSSHLLPRVWLNDILVAMLVTNCWSTLAVQHFMRHNPALERVVGLFADACICITMVVLVPSVLLAPYVSAFDLPNHRFGPSVSFYDPTFMAIFVLEAKLTFASSFADFVAKLIPHFAIYLTLDSISGLVVRRQKAVATLLVPMFVKVASIKPIEDHRSADTATRTSADPSKLKTVGWVRRAVKTIFCLWGIVILALHGHAWIVSNSTVVHGCRAATRPWLRSRISCSSLVVNCNKYGTITPNDIIFEQIDTSVLATLTLAHCPELSMPLSFPEFRNLMILHVYNSTVLSWGSEYSTFSNPRLSTVIVARSHVSPISAQALLLPMSLSTVQLCGTDLTSIPEVLPWSFHPMAVVAFDYGELTAISESLMSLQAFAISLKGNRLETIPQLAAMPPGQMFYGLELNDNPLRELPVSLASPMNFFIRLDLQRTNVTVLPPWTLTQVLGVIYMFGTPYCANMLPELRQRNVICFPRPATDPGMQLPFDLFNEMYAYDRD